MSSSTPLQCTGIEPNPDIAGIGVRVAIYAQALLSILYPVFAVSDGEISDGEYKTMTRFSVNILLTACALLVSTGIQAATFGISLYHALIILQLSGINSMTFINIYLVGGAGRRLNIARLRAGLRKFRVSEVDAPSDPQALSPAALLSSMHFIVVGGIGIWIWHEIQTFGNQPECNENTFLVVLSRTVYGELATHFLRQRSNPGFSNPWPDNSGNFFGDLCSFTFTHRQRLHHWPRP
jgi:hypothetical protein